METLAPDPVVNIDLEPDPLDKNVFEAGSYLKNGPGYKSSWEIYILIFELDNFMKQLIQS